MTIRRGNNIIAGAYNLDEYATKTDIQAKANLNLSNSTAITNCITEIPQDIKLELKDGTLTLKAGSKVYIPNGFEANSTPTVKLYAWTEPSGGTLYTDTPTVTTDSILYSYGGNVYNDYLSITSVDDNSFTIVQEPI